MMPSDRNESGTTFTLLGFSGAPEMQVLLFVIFLGVYTVTVVGNIGIIVIIKINPKLHTPMYFFLSHLSFVDFCYSSIIAPKMLVNLVLKDKTISFSRCITQFFFFSIFVVTEAFLLAAMAYDRFVAICDPLLYTITMSEKLCLVLVVGPYAWGIACSLILTCSTLQLSFHGSNIINHFFCEFSSLLSLSLSDTQINQLLVFIFSTFNAIGTLLIILLSYGFIVVNILKMRSASGRCKAFSTCASHLTAITIFYGIILFLYCVPNSKSSRHTVKVASVFYTVVIPMLNPLIYSLRNKDVKDTVNKIMSFKIGHMGEQNCTTVMEFTLLGLSDVPELRPVLFLVFLVIYGVTVLANLGMTALIQVSSQLHTPMYFFLSHLSFVDFCYSSVIIPKILANILNNDKTISFLACRIQFYLFCTCVITEVFLLAVMAYDRFVAICNPLLYMIIMSWRLQVELVSLCYLCASVCSLIHLCLAIEVQSYKSNVINHFFCDLSPLLSLACSDVTMNEMLLFIVATFNETITIVIILTSYLFILITILRMRSAEGRRKAFSTCASHLTAITIFHGTILSIYCRPTSGNIRDADKVATVFYTVVIPMLNPLIYSLRNKDVKEALRKCVSSRMYS
ncbi:olfactory receptor 5D16-like [Erethizon dorsatum]